MLKVTRILLEDSCLLFHSPGKRTKRKSKTRKKIEALIYHLSLPTFSLLLSTVLLLFQRTKFRHVASLGRLIWSTVEAQGIRSKTLLFVQVFSFICLKCDPNQNWISIKIIKFQYYTK